MLSRSHRLRSSKEIQRVRQNGRQWRHPLLILLASSRESVKPAAGAVALPRHSRFAFLASRHVGVAVVRNRAKRLLREAVRLHLADILPGWDCVLIARRATPRATFADVETAVMDLFARARLLTPHVDAQPPKLKKSR